MLDRMRRYTVMGAAAALFVAVGCSSDSGGVGVTEADFSITLDESSAPAGDVTFDIQNDAEQTHEFVVFKTDLAPDALPTNEDGDVDEEGEGVEHIDEVEDIAGGSSAELAVNLDAGAYVLICNLPGHYAQGMHTEFTVE
ncbi:MAG: sulfocyanin-like copper-binding protein [Actinomycetota bacterium]